MSTSAGIVTANTHGDLTATTNNDGVLTSIGYDPYGNPTRAGPANPFGYQGDYTDPTTAEVWMGARTYDPATATFTNRDTWAGTPNVPVTANRYSYANANPVNLVDPDGHAAATPEQLAHFAAGSEGATQTAGLALLTAVGLAGVWAILGYSSTATVGAAGLIGGVTRASTTAGAVAAPIAGAGMLVMALAAVIVTVLATPIFEIAELTERARARTQDDTDDATTTGTQPAPTPTTTTTPIPPPITDRDECADEAPNTTPDPNCPDSVVIGESTHRTSSAAAAFGARYWPGLSGPNVDHVAVCIANESWLRGEIASGTRVIDIGVDSSRQGSRSPYYELELRIIAETGYPVERRPWPASPNQYQPVYAGPCP